MKNLCLAILFLFFSTFTFAQYSQSQIEAYEKKNEKAYAIIDSTGKVVKEFYAKRAYGFNSGLARIYKYNMKTGKKLGGFMNTKGEIVVPLKYKDMRDFTEHVARVKFPGETRYSIIDKTGTPIINQKFADVFCKGRYCSFSADDEAAKKLKKEKRLAYKGLIDVVDKKILLDRSKFPSCGFANFNNNEPPIMTVIDLKTGKSGFSSVNNEMISNFFFKGCVHFGKIYGLGEKGIIDAKGNVVYLYPNGQKVFIASEKHKLIYRNVVKNPSGNRFGWVVLENFKGERILQDSVYDLIKFKNDYAIVTYSTKENVNKKTGMSGPAIKVEALIDYKGKMIIPKGQHNISFDIFDPNYVDVRIVVAGGEDKWRRYNIDGSYFSELDANKRIIFSAFGGANYSSYYDEEKKLYGIVNRKGEAVTPPIYPKHFLFGESGYAVVRLPSN